MMGVPDRTGTTSPFRPVHFIAVTYAVQERTINVHGSFADCHVSG